VILVDANILIYAHVKAFDQHQAAREWLDTQLNGAAPIGLPWASTLAFLRIVTNPRVFKHAEPMSDAWAQVVTWLGSESAWTPAPTERHAQIFGNLVSAPGLGGNLVPDAHLAALAIEHGLTLCSTDGDFARFPGLRWINPLSV